MCDAAIGCSIDHRSWSRSQIAMVEYNRHIHVLHEMKRLGAAIEHDGIPLTHDEINFLNASDARDACVAARQTHGIDGMTHLYQDLLRASDRMWKEVNANDGREAPVQFSTADFTVSCFHPRFELVRWRARMVGFHGGGAGRLGQVGGQSGQQLHGLGDVAVGGAQPHAEAGGEAGVGVPAAQVGQDEQGLAARAQEPPAGARLLAVLIQAGGQVAQGLAGHVDGGGVDKHAKPLVVTVLLGRKPIYRRLLAVRTPEGRLGAVTCTITLKTAQCGQGSFKFLKCLVRS
ncbi:catechol 2,3-dioxygenase-like lactoylglutathione lyase family enzyme [Streptomonospora salina]|uniref:Catechol 2,3-dioxygenase-like lactoylglutathione lyase family enzyme n=1 Tax=Streptomonospora salina TaxID=104205 RepID=A0A841E7A6_9ACTN|nr:catechol 2,3-dioxygenase-like lactoylglutathione lyase family enzyme [Streptomonospora salina]